MFRLTNLFLLFFVLVVLAPAGTYAFGAGDIPDFSFLNGKAFRHGDIESVLENLAKTAGRPGGGSLLGFAASVLSSATGGKKFNRMDIKRVYFGNWLRDYSQAMDIAGLSKLTADTIILVLSALGFMTFGFATEEFQITPERLSVYLPVEHIDNPKGYAEKEGDARQFHPKLRPPVDPRELEVDDRTGMKNYMATENEGWDTSTAFIRRTFEACIEHGRRAQGEEGGDLWEAYRLLGTGLHTLEDLLAHSNWCELALKKMGHDEVFCHVGDNVYVNSPNGRVPPLVTGTFGSSDFIHSLLGEATDKMSEASVTNLYEKMEHSNDQDSTAGLQNILSKLPLGGGDGGNDAAARAEDIKAKAYDFDPDKVAPQEVQQRLLEILKWHDDVFRDVAKKLEMVPGLQDLLDELTQALNAYVYTLIAPWLTPIVQQVTGILDEGSKAVIDNDDQFEVFNNPDASDPSHSLLSKDHFGLILNEPAGKIAQRVVEHTVELIVQAWSDDRDPGRVVDTILEAFHHPYYARGNSTVQNTMMEEMERWFGSLDSEEGSRVIEKLTKESVREGRNKREGGDETEAPGGGHGHGHGGPYGGGYNSGGGSYEQPQEPEYQGGGGGGYGYGGGRYEQQTQSSTDYGNRYESRNEYENTGYEGGRGHEEESYSRRDDNEGYGGYGRRDNDNEGYGGGHRYGRDEEESESYSYRRRNEDEGYERGEEYESNENRHGYGHRTSGYGEEEERVERGYQPSYGYGRRRDEEEETFGAERLNLGDDY